MTKGKELSKDNVEQRILEAAKAVFIEKGFAETNMSDIAEAAGINRSALHYYYRTKEKMFEAVFGPIIMSMAPRVQDIIIETGAPIKNRMEKILGMYFDLISANPSLPLFVMREVQRDPEHIISVVNSIGAFSIVEKILSSLALEMESGSIRRVPPQYLFFTVVGLITAPFLTKNVVTLAMLPNGQTFKELIEQWKPYVVNQVVFLLTQTK